MNSSSSPSTVSLCFFSESCSSLLQDRQKESILLRILEIRIRRLDSCYGGASWQRSVKHLLIFDRDTTICRRSARRSPAYDQETYLCPASSSQIVNDETWLKIVIFFYIRHRLRFKQKSTWYDERNFGVSEDIAMMQADVRRACSHAPNEEENPLNCEENVDVRVPWIRQIGSVTFRHLCWKQGIWEMCMPNLRQNMCSHVATLCSVCSGERSVLDHGYQLEWLNKVMKKHSESKRILMGESSDLAKSIDMGQTGYHVSARYQARWERIGSVTCETVTTPTVKDNDREHTSQKSCEARAKCWEIVGARSTWCSEAWCPGWKRCKMRWVCVPSLLAIAEPADVKTH